MASESERGQTKSRNIFGVRATKKVERKLSGMAWEGQRDSVRVTYAKSGSKAKLTQSTAGHEEPGGKEGGPSSKPKYYPVTDREEYCEGKVKRTPGGE